MGGRLNLPLPKPELYNVQEDPEEGYNRAPKNPRVVADIQARVEKLIATFPLEVRSAYEETKKRKVQLTPENAPPIADNGG